MIIKLKFLEKSQFQDLKKNENWDFKHSFWHDQVRHFEIREPKFWSKVSTNKIKCKEIVI